MESQAQHAQLISHDPLHAALPNLPLRRAGERHGDRLRGRLAAVLQLMGDGQPGDGSFSTTPWAFGVLFFSLDAFFFRCKRTCDRFFRVPPW